MRSSGFAAVASFLGAIAAQAAGAPLEVTAESVPATAPAPFRAGKADFAVEFRDHVLPYEVMAVFVAPGEAVEFEIAETPPERTFRLAAAGGKMVADGTRRWKWRAPAEPGLYPLTISEIGAGDSMTINAFVIVPLDRVRKGSLNGYRIGSYPARPLKGLEIYRAPAGLVEVTAGNVDTPVSPHFTLGQFLCKQEGGYPKYLVLRTRLLLKLELLLEKTNDRGFRCDTFHVMSGYRTPYYNQAIGNVKYSRHVFGGAADIFIDENPRDGWMDDLNGDGKIDVKDAAVLYEIIDGLYGKPFYQKFAGGLGQYRKTDNHGPFVHVDVRGFRARWGD